MNKKPIQKQVKISGHKPPEQKEERKGSGVSQSASFLSSSPACNLCGNVGYWKSRNGVVQTCVQCLQKLGAEQFL